jgi:hypothetical protein
MLPPPQPTAQLPSPELTDANEPTPRPGKLPRATSEQPPLDSAPEPTLPQGTLPSLPPLYPRLPEPPDTAQLPAVDLDLASPRMRARGTPRGSTAPGEQIRTLVFAPEPTRAAWIDRELSHAPITIQIGRSARNVVAALTRDPPPRPDVLVVDFDAISPVELVELHAIRPGGWFGRLIAIGHVPLELRTVFGVDDVLATPLVRDSLLDCVAGTRHAAVTTACPVIPGRDDRS